MKVSLTVDGGRHNGKLIAIGLKEVLIGRDEKCNIQLDSEEVSRVHCSLVVQDSEVLLRDQKSSNGTFVNKRRLRGELQMEDGDSIQVGPQLFTINIVREDEEFVVDEEAMVVGEDPQTESGSTTVIGRVPVIDPSELEEGEQKRLHDRLKDL